MTKIENLDVKSIIIDGNLLDTKNDTLLYLNDDPLYNKILETNINFDNINSDLGINALHQSIIFDNFELFKKLLTKNININTSDFYGNTPLHYILIEISFQNN